MYHNFREIEETILASKIKKRIALAGAHDSYSLEAVIYAKNKGLISATLLGKVDEIRNILLSMNEDPTEYEMVECEDDEVSSKLAVAMVYDKRADIPMKGLIQTSSFMRAILDKEKGLLPSGGLICQSTIVEYPKENRLFQISDCAINIAPDYEAKVKIIENTVKLAKTLGIELPKVAIISALEVVNPKIPSTVDAQKLKQANEQKLIQGCIVGGPFALDNAISIEAAKHKGITDPVAGQADILVVPDLCTGNVLTKSLIFFSQMKTAGTLLGTTTPVIAASRTDTAENKYHAILIALLNAQ